MGILQKHNLSKKHKNKNKNSQNQKKPNFPAFPAELDLENKPVDPLVQKNKLKLPITESPQIVPSISPKARRNSHTNRRIRSRTNSISHARNQQQQQLQLTEQQQQKTGSLLQQPNKQNEKIKNKI